MGFLRRWFIRMTSLGTAVFLVYGTWRIWKGNGFELAALAFSAAGVVRSVLLAWLRRAGDVSLMFRSKATAFIATPLEEAAFLAPLYASPALYTTYGLLTTLWAVPASWLILRTLVRMVLGKSNQGTRA